MTDKELLKQLNSLKSIKMNENQKESNKKVLLTQISNTISSDFRPKPFNNFFFYFKNILSIGSKPAMVIVGVFLFAFVSLSLGIGNNFYKNSKPNDSLYIARVISEKAKLNTVFNSQERDRLAAEFASRHAEDIAILLMDPEFNNEDNQAEVAKLTASFKNEMEKVKTNVKKIEEAEIAKNNQDQDTGKSKDDLVFSASNLKDANGIEISLPEEIDIPENNLDAIDLPTEGDKSSSSAEVVSSVSESETSETEIENLGNQIEELSEQINLENNQEIKKDRKALIAEIEKLFNEGNYSEVVLKLQEIK